ncbi:MAG: DUF1569 domain-containing protein [Phycisphaerae bacterium]
MSPIPTHRGGRRGTLIIPNLHDVLVLVDALTPDQRTIGHWSLGQICKHLADSIHGSIDGFDLRRHRIKRFFFARSLLWFTYRYGIPAGYTVDPKLAPPGDIGLDEAIGELRDAIQRYQRHAGPLHAHPLFGRLSRPAWDRLHCFHCAHHLSFVLPGNA